MKKNSVSPDNYKPWNMSKYEKLGKVIWPV